MALQHLRSNTANKRPDPTAMADGQLAINTPAVSPGLFFKDAAGVLVKVGPVHVGTTAPNASPASGGTAGNSVGEQWLDTTGGTYVFKVWDGSAWRSESGTFVDVNGDVMTGALGIIAGSAAAPGLYFSGDTNTGIYSPGADQLAISTSGAQRLVVDASGNIGVGMTPTDVAGFNSLQLSDSNGTYLDFYTGATQQARIISLPNDFRINQVTSGTLGFWTNNQERLRITSSGLVGVGTSTPESSLHVSGAAKVSSGADSGGYQVRYSGANSSSRSWRLTNDINAYGDFDIQQSTTQTGSTFASRLYISASGSVGVGTTSPTGIFEACGSSSYFRPAGAAGTFLQITAGAANGDVTLNASANSGGYPPLVFSTGGGEKVRIDSSGRLGIGDSAPTQLLTIFNPSSGNPATSGSTQASGAFRIRASGTTGVLDFGIGAGGTKQWIQSTDSGALNNNYSLLLNPNGGNVGIGTTSPSTTLDIAGATGSSTTANLLTLRNQSAANAGNIAQMQFFCSNTFGGGEAVAAIQALNPNASANNGGALVLAVSSNGTATTPSERLRIDSSGRLLVGTSTSLLVGTSLGGQFQVASTSVGLGSITTFVNNENAAFLVLGKSRGTSIGSFTIVQDNDELGVIRFAGADGTDLQTTGASIAAAVDGTPGANDLPTRLVFSTCGDGASSPTEALRIDNQRCSLFVGSTQSKPAVDVCSSRGIVAGEFLYRGSHSATPSSGSPGTVVFTVGTNGNVQNTNNSYGAISDIKLKENIVDANSQWDDLKALQVRNYNFKEGQTHTQIGLVAQEVELVSPGLVAESPDRDAEGNDLGTVTKSVNYSVLYMKAVKALQEAMERIETLEQRLNDAGIN